MDIKNLLLALNGCEDEIQKLMNKRFVVEDLSGADKGRLSAYQERKNEVIRILEGAGYEMHWILDENVWAISLKRSVEGTKALSLGGV